MLLSDRAVAPATIIPSPSPLLSSASSPPVPIRIDRAAALFAAGECLSVRLGEGRPVDARTLREAMEAAFGGTDAAGAWCWKDAYEACEVAQVVFLRRFGAARQAKPVAARLAMLSRRAAADPHAALG